MPGVAMVGAGLSEWPFPHHRAAHIKTHQIGPRWYNLILKFQYFHYCYDDSLTEGAVFGLAVSVVSVQPLTQPTVE